MPAGYSREGIEEYERHDRRTEQELYGPFYGLGIVKDKRLLIRHFTEDWETVEKICDELRKLDKQPTPKEAEDLIMDVIIREHSDRIEIE